MPNKKYDKLSPLDRAIREAIGGLGPANTGVLVTVKFFADFEAFNTRPYHNYETWAGGYEVEGYGIKVRREDLDDAVAAWAVKRTEQKAAFGVPAWLEGLSPEESDDA